MGSIWLYGEFMMSTKFDWQGKREEQIKSSMTIASISVMCMFVLILLFPAGCLVRATHQTYC